MSVTFGGPDEILQQAWNYRIAIDQIGEILCMEAGPFDAEPDAIEAKFGGAPTVKLNGRPNYADIILKFGVSKDRRVHDWAMQCINASYLGLKMPKKGIDVIALLGTDREHYRIRIANAFVGKESQGTFSATATEVVIQELMLKIDRWQRIG